MVDITPAPRAEQQVIQAYGGGGFRISGERYEGPVLVFPDRTLAWQVVNITALCADDFAALQDAAAGIELLIVGTGHANQRLDASLGADLTALDLAVETMDTGAACRTYNVLLLEDRRVAAALLPID